MLQLAASSSVGLSLPDVSFRSQISIQALDSKIWHSGPEGNVMVFWLSVWHVTRILYVLLSCLLSNSSAKSP